MAADSQPVFVGDVQGCADELEELVGRAEARFGNAFELLLVGDLVNRGPGNLRVLRLVRELEAAGRARCVLGNHDLHLLRVAGGAREMGPLDSFGDVLAAPDAADWLAWLASLPLAITGRLGEQPYALVHAAVPPDWDLATLEQRARRAEARLSGEGAAWLAGDPAADPDLDTLLRVTACRSVEPGSQRWSPEPPAHAPAGFVAWHDAWRSRGHAYGVVYGHWSLQGLHVAPGLRGLDTGCVHHGRGRDGFLTAWLPAPDGERPFSAPDERFWQVPARRAYYAHRDAPPSDGSEKR